jgi:hypothetical protein
MVADRPELVPFSGVSLVDPVLDRCCECRSQFVFLCWRGGMAILPPACGLFCSEVYCVIPWDTDVCWNPVYLYRADCLFEKAVCFSEEVLSLFGQWAVDGPDSGLIVTKDVDRADTVAVDDHLRAMISP